jgi:hypothetical protein
MYMMTLEQVQELARRAGDEGLWSSFGSQEHGEAMTGCPRGSTGRDATALRDVSVRSLADSSEQLVVAHTELGAIFLQMLVDDEL